jgi:hypothetical protein
MAKILAEMPRKAAGAGRKPIYPYDEWLDGQIRQLEGGKDFTAKPGSVLTSIRQTADARGLKLRTRYTNDGKDVIIQAYEPEPEIPPVVAPPVVRKSTKRPRAKVGA